jgi:hypothetical protein
VYLLVIAEMETECNCARIRQEMSCRPVLCTDWHSWRIVCVYLDRPSEERES